MKQSVRINRREFVKVGAGAGFALGVSLSACLPSRDRVGRRGRDPTVWLRIGGDGRITVTVARSEMGQGVHTALPMIVAEELEADWRQIRIEPALSDPERYGSQRTGGSMSIRTSWDRLRVAGATARELLITAAARKWGVSRRACRAEKGFVVHRRTGRRLAYRELAGVVADVPLPFRVVLKDPAEFEIVGKPVKRLDTPSKVDGSAVFGFDVSRPGLLCAVLERCPVIGGSLASYDESAALKIPGVRNIVRIGESVAVVASSTWAAMEGRSALKVQWNEGPNATLSSDEIFRRFRELSGESGVELQRRGDPKSAFRRCSKVLTGSYETPFLAHAPMEPMNCTADVRGGRCEIWAPTQVPNEVQQAAAKTAGVDPKHVTVHITLLGGGFGRRLVEDYAVEAVSLSKAIGAPVKVIWTREDDMRHGFYRPASRHVLRGGLDRRGWPHAWEHTMVSPSILSQLGFTVRNNFDEEVKSELTSLYWFPHLRIGHVMENTAVPVSWMRSVYNAQAAYAEECFLDELATAGAKDPVDVRLRLLDRDLRFEHGVHVWNPIRLRRVVELAASKAGWGSPLLPGRFRGIACHGCYLSYAAMVVEVSLEGRTLRVHRVVAAVDCGIVVNPDTVRAQVEGGIVFALSAARHGSITVQKGRIAQSNFNDYRLLRIQETPDIEVHIVPSRERPTGIGEIPVPPVAPALSNALFAATGKPVRRLPLLGPDE